MTTATLNTSVSTDEAAIHAVVEAMRRANHDKNAALFAAQFTPDAVIYNLAPPLVHHGVDVREKQAWLDSWSTPVDIDARDLQVPVAGDFAFCHEYLRL